MWASPGGATDASCGLQGVPQRRRWRKNPSGPCPREDRNHLERDFSAAEPSTKKGLTDRTSIRTAQRYNQCSAVLDLCSGLVVGWSMSPRQERRLVVQAVLMAL